ncbi:MAG: hypothetical protein LBV41_07260 [Cytophagaceae bacterium]|jgi:hypothetical protein|nr:hypothetical protein [Cytophagaceae bacterium]
MESIATTQNETLNKYRNRFLIGILIYNITTCLLGELIPGVVWNLIQLVGLAMFGYYWLKLASFKNITSKYLLISISLLLIWEIYIVYHGFIFQYNYLKDHLFSQLRTTSYLLPLAVFIAVDSEYFARRLFQLIHRLGIVFLVFLPFCLPLIFSTQSFAFAEQYIWTFSLSSGFILLTLGYHTQKKVMAIIVTVVGFLIITIVARRNIMFSYLFFFLFSFLFVQLINKKNTLVKRIVLISGFILCLAAVFLFYQSEKDGMFRKFTQRATEDSRQTVFLYYFLDMTTRDFIIGKGINGTYYAPNVDRSLFLSTGVEPEHRNLDNRIHIENGFLQLILNGGIVYLALYLLVLLPAVFKGLFFSRNMFSKACAIFVFCFILDMIPFGLPTFTFRHFLVWFAVAFCYSKKITQMSEDEMQKFLVPDRNTETHCSASLQLPAKCIMSGDIH